MKQSLQLKIGQSLTMTPQLQQAIRLLQLSSLELSTEVHDALESNMMLELDDNDGGPGDSAAENGAVTAEPVAELPADAENEPATLASGDQEVNAGGDEIPEDLPVDTDWGEVYDSLSSGPARASGDADDIDFESLRGTSESLKDHLTFQLEMEQFSPQDREIGRAIIEEINRDGYLETDIAELAEILNQGQTEEPLEVEEVAAVLKRIQAFSPTGVGARNLRECLLLQLREFDPATPWLAEARRLVNDFLDALGAHDYATLMRRTKLKPEQLAEAIALIQTLNPRPGSEFAPDDTEYVVPDVYVRKVNDIWRVDLNAEAIPRVRINQTYAGFIRRGDSSQDNSTLKTHLQEARWFIKSLASRNETLLKVAGAIVERQRGFLEHGEEAMKPMVLADIAEELGLHESTISRVTTRKYMHTPRGIFELKYFFSSHVGTAMGGEASSTAIRAVIKKLIAAENTRKPLSDSKLAKLLEDQGINVARRTVAKYRESMHIPPSNERKRLT